MTWLRLYGLYRRAGNGPLTSLRAVLDLMRRT